MYKINKSTNSIEKLKESSFSALSFKETENLEVWIAKNPESLGEELLIIQRQYSEFDGTAERLDLLALDKESNLVVIENKLDDSGKDVVGQAIKYAAYCSRNTTEEIIKIYQEYLDSNNNGEDAKSSIMEFLQTEDEDELILSENEVRIILVANKYRPEATSTVLWLLKQGHKIKCFKATPIVFEEHEFLNIEQIIPQPDTQGYMISLYEKERENVKKSDAVKEKEVRLLKFWTQFKQAFSDRGHQHLDEVTISRKPYIGFSTTSVLTKSSFGFVVGTTASRLELYFILDEDKRLYDEMKKHKIQLEDSFGEELDWMRLEGKKPSKITIETKDNEDWAQFEHWENFHEENWSQHFDWFINKFEKFYDAAIPIMKKVQSNRKVIGS